MRKLLVGLVVFVAPATAEPGLRFDRVANPVPSPPGKPARGTIQPISLSDFRALLSRLPGLSQDPAPATTLWRGSSLPDPVVTKVLEVPFPAQLQPEPPPTLPVGAPELDHFGPVGEVDSSAQVQLSFKVPVAEPDKVRVRLTPSVAGEWRWVGTQALIFQPQTRLPMATSFRVEMQGVKSASWAFETAPPLLKTSYPTGGKVRRTPVLFLGFNQRVDPDQVLSRLVFNGPALRRARPEEIEGDQQVRELVGESAPGTWLAVVPSQPLDTATRYMLTLQVGVRSQEGPRSSTREYVTPFTTYRPLVVDRVSQNPEPGEAILVSFSNDLAAEQKVNVTATPEIPGLETRTEGNFLWIAGRTRARTTYRLQLPAGLVDVFGQKSEAAIPLEFRTGDALQRFIPPSERFLLLDPHGPPQLNFRCVNQKTLAVQIRAVKPEDWAAFRESDGILPGRLISDREIEANTVQDEMQTVRLDLRQALEESSNLVVTAGPNEEREPRYRGWIQRSRLGANLAADHGKLLVWVNELATGAAVEGARVSFLGSAEAVSTNDDGLASLAATEHRPALLVERGTDSLLVKLDSHFTPEASEDNTLWYVSDDRKLYKPGETVSLKGWLRREIHLPRGQIELVKDQPLSYELIDSRQNVVGKGTALIGRLGGFDVRVDLPRDIHLGRTRVELKCGASSHSHSFAVEEFRQPEFEVSTRTQDERVVLGGLGTWAVDARYFAGGGLANAAVHWDVEARPGQYSPPHWADFTFGDWQPWWDCNLWWQGHSGSDVTRKTFTDKTDSQGKNRLTLKFISADEPRPYFVAATATVADLNRQAWRSSSSLLVHPASVYVGLKAERTFVQAGQPFQTRVVVTDLQGRALQGRPVHLRLSRWTWTFGGHVDKQEVSATQFVSGDAPLSVSVPTGAGGTYELSATARDGSNRANCSRITLWVAGGEPPPPTRRVELQKLTMIPNKKVYAPGEVAEILVEAPTRQARGLVTLERHGLVSHQLLDLTGGSNTLKIPLEDDYFPNLRVTVDAVGEEPRRDEEGRPLPESPTRPMQARGSLNLMISSASRELSVQVKPGHPQARPGAMSHLDVRVLDAGGHPVRDAEVAVLVVDESVLTLVKGVFENPLSCFSHLRPAEVFHEGVRRWIELALPDEMPSAAQFPPPSRVSWGSNGAVGATNITYGPFEFVGDLGTGASAFQGFQTLSSTRQSRLGIGPGPGATNITFEEGYRAVPGSGNKLAPIRLRQNFSPLALFKPALRTNADGRAGVTFKLPDNLTRYRVVALAAAGERQFGKGESTLVAREPLMVRPSAPRFLSLGDRCEMPLLVQNQTDHPLLVRLACRASNVKLDPGRAGVRVQVPARDRVEVKLPLVTETVGRGHVQIAASGGDFADAAEVDFPVRPPASTEAVASYGVVDEGGISQPIDPPSDVHPEVGGLEVSTSSTALAELTDAFIYLQNYPYECCEQLASRVLSTVALAPVLQAFDAPGVPGRETLKVRLAADIKKLEGLQNSDGGWDYWRRGRPSIPYCSLHVAHALVRLRQGGYAVPDSTYDRALEYASRVAERIPSEYPSWCRLHLRSYAVYILERAGRSQKAPARELLRDYGDMANAPLEALGWLLPTLSDQPEGEAIRREMQNRVTQTAATAQFTTGYREDAHLVLASEAREDAICLEALIHDSPQSPLLPKLVRGLLAQRRHGRWVSTQENCFVLLALHEYFQKFEKLTPDFVARVWLGDRYAGQQIFRGRNTDARQIRVPMSELQGADNVCLTKQGSGRLYYRLGLNYAPRNLRMRALERGFSVDRLYQGADDPADVTRDAQGVWHMKAGTRVKVTLTMVAPTNRYHVALVDPLPAGLEALNPALGAAAPTGRVDWNVRWYEHENLRDERVEAFTAWLHPGVHSYSYYARATTCGKFTAAPAKAEEMYAPETFGRSASAEVLVEP